MKSPFAGVTPENCFFPFHLPLDRNGYSFLSNGQGSKSRGHRIAYRLFCGSVPPGAMVLHECGNAQCVNPYHLYLGDAAQNAIDREQHGKTARGFSVPQTKLSDADVLAIRASTARVTELAKQYSTSKSNISSIRSMRNRPNVHGATQKVEA